MIQVGCPSAHMSIAVTVTRVAFGYVPYQKCVIQGHPGHICMPQGCVSGCTFTSIQTHFMFYVSEKYILMDYFCLIVSVLRLFIMEDN